VSTSENLTRSAIDLEHLRLLSIFHFIFLRDRRHRTFSMAIAALDCLHIPFGTILGILTFIVLGRDSVRALYHP